MMKIRATSVTNTESGAIYTVGKSLGGTDEFTLYDCSLSVNASEHDPGRCCILKITTHPKHNGILDRESFTLKMMLDEAARQEAMYLGKNPGVETRMNYHFTFPNLVDTFISADQGNRRVMILGMGCIATALHELVPLSHLESKDNVRVDQRTSAWIMGKLLKTLAFAHSMGIMNGAIHRDNVLINRDGHFVSLFDWSKALRKDQVEQQEKAQEIAKLAQAITLALGGDQKTGRLPEDQKGHDDYVRIIRKLAIGKECDALQAHQEFYTVVDRLWPREFYPFTTHKLR